MLALNKANAVTGYKKLFSGGQDTCAVDVKTIFRNALFLGATAIVVCHNHPSGRINPSPEDLQITKRINDAGKILEIKLMDHIIIAGDNFFSFRDHGMIDGITHCDS